MKNRQVPQMIDREESKKEEWKPGGDFGDVDVSQYD